jgi:hypothetical protein
MSVPSERILLLDIVEVRKGSFSAEESRRDTSTSTLPYTRCDEISLPFFPLTGAEPYQMSQIACWGWGGRCSTIPPAFPAAHHYYQRLGVVKASVNPLGS